MFDLREETDPTFGHIWAIYHRTHLVNRRIYWADNPGEATEFLEELCAEYDAREMD